MSYIDALFDREHDRIHVVERRDGERRYQEYAPNYTFYYDDPRGLNDTVKAVAEELDIKPNILKKAIKLAHKSEFGREQQDHELLEQILTTVGKTL